ncbi:MAG TPA: aldo/keto reductase [Solirubrobacteraceae bacterium]|nr:aldo/keto reductase [Solirubrobacteraceae bacterium]
MSSAAWLDPSELRIGLGCMRLSGEETITAAAQAGITVFDTARAYGDSERLLAGALRRGERHADARIVTKGGMARSGDAWIPDGRAKAIAADCEASLVALAGLPIDLYLLHAPDPRTPWPTSIRALARLVEDGVVRRVGLSNVNRTQLDEALELAPIAAVEVALSAYDDRALRGGVVERCAELGIAVLAHSPLGGPRRAGALARRPPWNEVAEARGASAAEVALAWLLALSPAVIAIPGARRPSTARSAARAATLTLEPAERAVLGGALTAPARPRLAAAPPAEGAEIVLVMGIPGAGKSRVAEEYVDRGYLRLNRDERGGGLRKLAETLDDALSAGGRRVVLDNTYLSRAARSYVIDSARRHGLPARCVWLNTPLAQAQVNVVERLLEEFGRLPTPEEVRSRARSTPGVLMPTSQMRALRELEPPASDEGFAEVEVVPFTRSPSPALTGSAVYVAAAALRDPGWEAAVAAGDRGAHHLVFDWIADGAPDALEPWIARLADAVSGPVHGAFCPHAAGPPRCWCRPPLPGLALAFARAHDLDPSRSALIGAGPAHRTLATALGARYVAV